MKIKMSKKYAYVTSCFHLVVLNDKKIGFRCSLEAESELSKSKSAINVYSTLLKNKIVWVSEKEFKENNLTEKEVPHFKKI